MARRDKDRENRQFKRKSNILLHENEENDNKEKENEEEEETANRHRE